MKYNELYKHISETKYVKVGKDVDYTIEVDHESKIVRLLYAESNSKLDWYHNLTFFSRVYKKQVSVIKAHKGYIKAYKSAKDIIMPQFIQTCEEYPGYKPVISGWSFGGAMSQLSAEDFNFRTRTDASVPNTGKKAVLVTFGSPKVIVGEKARKYVLSCCLKVIEVAHKNDIVTYLPPFTWYKNLNLTNNLRLGDKFNILKLLNPHVYHTIYSQVGLYGNVSEHEEV